MANGIKIGNLDISAFKVGSADTKVYLGDTLLYPTAPPSFQGKWLATYTGGTTSSAECDASSAITQNEITLTDLVSVEIGNCVTSIGEMAFKNCTSLTTIAIPNTITIINYEAFRYCTSLTSVTIPNNVTSIGGNAFYSCRSFTSITIPNSVTSIGNNAFNGCYGLSSITVDSNNSAYDSRNNCNAIIKKSNNELIVGCKNTVIPDSVTSIGSSAFYYCSGLTSVELPSGVTSIGRQAFQYCTGLTSITVNATTPPTLSNVNALNNTNNCPIYVPAASVDTYKAASGWSTYASRIQAIPNS